MTFFIAEIGINHNGDLDIAKKLIDAAKWSGADIVKFQKRSVEVVYANQLNAPRESPWGTTLVEQKLGLEFGKDQYDYIDNYCRDVGIPWFASAWDIGSLKFLKQYDLPFNKIASAMATNAEFVDAVASQGKPTFLSTGMCTMEDIDKARLQLLSKKCKTTILHCVGSYPAPEEDLNLNMIPVLRRQFGDHCEIGYSGHEVSVSPSVMAAVLGATVIERHITIDRAMYGSDQAASLEPVGFKTMVDQIRKIPTCVGDGVKRITPAEEIVAKKLRYWL